MKRRFRKMLLLMELICVCLAGTACAILSQEKFGRNPEGERLERVQASLNYRGGEFHNTVPTPMLVEGQSSIGIMLGNLFAKKERLRPANALPTVKPDLTALDQERDVLIWLGHSS